jgi:sugar lactone lactonase YvrE
MSAFTAAWVTAGEILTIGNPDFRITSIPGGSQRTHLSPQTNPMGIVRPDSRPVLTAGDSVTLVRTDTESWESTEVARLGVSPSVNELARDRDGTVYLASYYPTAEPGLTFAVIRLTELNGVGNSAWPPLSRVSWSSSHKRAARTRPMPAPKPMRPPCGAA